MVVGHIRGTYFDHFKLLFRDDLYKAHLGSGPVELAADGDGLDLDGQESLSTPLRWVTARADTFELFQGFPFEELSPPPQSPSWTQLGRQS